MDWTKEYEVLVTDAEKKAEFDVTRCPECNSDEIYSFSDSDGGLCTKCKLMIEGPIRGGISKLEMRRRRGELVLKDVDDSKLIENERKSASENLVAIKQNIEMMKRNLGRSSTMVAPVLAPPRPEPPKAAKPMPEKKEGPGFIERTVGVFRKFQEEIKKTAPKEEVKPEAPKTVAPVAIQKIHMDGEAARVFDVGKPHSGESWTLKACIVCRRKQAVDGQVMGNVAGLVKKFVWIKDSLGREYYGCFLCAKRV